MPASGLEWWPSSHVMTAPNQCRCLMLITSATLLLYNPIYTRKHSGAWCTELWTMWGGIGAAVISFSLFTCDNQRCQAKIKLLTLHTTSNNSPCYYPWKITQRNINHNLLFAAEGWGWLQPGGSPGFSIKQPSCYCCAFWVGKRLGSVRVWVWATERSADRWRWDGERVMGSLCSSAASCILKQLCASLTSVKTPDCVITVFCCVLWDE